MTYDELALLPERFHSIEVRQRAMHNYNTYRQLRFILRDAARNTKWGTREHAENLRRHYRGIDLGKFHSLMERVLGEEICW